MAQICDTCHAFKVFGKNCWYFWERKKACSQFKIDAEDLPHSCSVDKWTV
ncbi:MAG: hypothetical protein HY363_03650 [Candidatus Aenigmarchaeota archaeon]|nr:hypothetical protein [Candidatus Aenigmarchaeota archaeon]